MTAPRLTTFVGLPPAVRIPGYDPREHGAGIVHIGVGAFHKAHQAVFTDDAMARSGGDWRIIGVSLRSPDAGCELNPQNGLYTLIENGPGAASPRVVASIQQVLHAPRERNEVIAALCDPATRIVSLTVTEKAYGIDRDTGGADVAHPAVAADLADPDAARGVLGLLTLALRRRRADGTVPFTVLCCDNLPDNGAVLRAAVLDFAGRIDPDLANWIAGAVAFPSTMVDRITPARTDDTAAKALELTGCADHAAVATEPFRQWVIEDRFPNGRPDWAAAGALFVDDVGPYERMKLRMLNGAHSMLAYCGFLAGLRCVSDVMDDPDLAPLVARHLRAAAATLDPLPGIDLGDYAQALLGRFANPQIAHETYQIAMDGSQKLPQRIFDPAVEAIRRGQSLRPFALATAAWMRYCLGRDDKGVAYDLRDPRAAQIAACQEPGLSAAQIVDLLMGLDGFCPAALQQNGAWRDQVADDLHRMTTRGMRGFLATRRD